MKETQQMAEQLASITYLFGVHQFWRHCISLLVLNLKDLKRIERIPECKLFGKGPSRLRATSGTLVLVYLPNSSF